MEQKWQMQGGGTLTLSQEGNRVRLEAERPEDSQGLYKVWLTGAQGGRLLLGTLAPERGALRLRRTLSVGELERAGCWPPQGAQAPLAFPFSASERWYREQHPEQLVRDPVLKKRLKRIPLVWETGSAKEAILKNRAASAVQPFSAVSAPGARFPPAYPSPSSSSRTCPAARAKSRAPRMAS